MKSEGEPKKKKSGFFVVASIHVFYEGVPTYSDVDDGGCRMLFWTVYCFNRWPNLVRNPHNDIFDVVDRATERQAGKEIQEFIFRMHPVGR